MATPRFDPFAPRRTRLNGVRLANFKSVRSGSVTLRPLTVVAGANSTGKSTLIQAVLALTQVTRRRIDGRRFPLNHELTRLGTFVSLRHQAADPGEPVVLGTAFSSDELDVRRNAEFRSGRPTSGRGRDPRPIEVGWAVELDSAVEGQIGSAQIAALDVSVSGTDFDFSSRIERTSELSELRSSRSRIDDARVFSGTIRSDASETPVLDAAITSGQAAAFFGVPPDAATRVREWFLGIEDQEADEPQAPLSGGDRERAIQQAAWAVRRDVEPPPEFVAWYRSLDTAAQEQLETEVLTAFEADRSRSPARRGGVERLEGRGPMWLAAAQRTCARYLATQVRYVGPLRQSPQEPFGSAPDPDSGEVGGDGRYVAAVLQANSGLRDSYPMPPGTDHAGGTKTVTLGEAVDAWMAHLGLANSLTVRENTPLVLSIDLVPPGLDAPVALGSVGVGVSQVLPIVVQCLVAGRGALIVLEQPELHLHPGAQQRLADFLLACTEWGQNILVESHSEYLVLRLRRRIAEDASDRLRSQVGILFAERGTDGATIYRDVELTETGGVVDWPVGFFDQGTDEAHQLLVAAAQRQRAQEEMTDVEQ